MKMTKSNSILLKNNDTVKVSTINLTSIRQNSLQNKQIPRFNKSLMTLNRIKSSNTPQPNGKAKPVPLISVKSMQNPKKKPKESKENYLLNTLKTYILKSSRELNMIHKEIPKFSARKIQDLKKGYKFTEDYDGLASSFLTIFLEIDPDLKKEATSLRMKAGESLIGYFSNSGKFIKILKNLSEILKKTEISSRALNDSLKILETVKRPKLSANYQELYDFMQLILGYFRGKKSSTRALGDHSNISFSSNSKTPEKMTSTQYITTNPTENSFSDYSKPMSCCNKSISQISLFKKPPKTPKDAKKAFESTRSASHSSLTKRVNRLDDCKNSENEGSSKENCSSEKKKEWDEIRQHKRCAKAEKFEDMIKELNLKRLEDLKFEKLVQEQKKKEKLEIKQFRDEDFLERKRLKGLKKMKEKKEIEDEISRNLQRSLIVKN